MELLERILERGNLNEAYKRVYVNKGASGVDGVTVEELLDYRRQENVSMDGDRRVYPMEVCVRIRGTHAGKFG